MGLREQVRDVVSNSDDGALEALVADQPRAVRHLLGLSYRADPALRRAAARGIALAARHHPELVASVVRRLIWAMNDESGTNALCAPEVLLAIADERPALLLPMVPELMRLGADPGLRDGLAQTLRAITASCPGEVGKRVADDLAHPEQRRARDRERLERYRREKKITESP